MSMILRVLIDTKGAMCSTKCRFLDSVVDSCTLFGKLEHEHLSAPLRHANCVKASVDARPTDLRNSVKGRPQLVRIRRG